MRDIEKQKLIIINSFCDLVSYKLDLENAENRLRKIHREEDKTAISLYEDSLQSIRKLLWHSVLTDLCWFYDSKGDRSIFWYLDQTKRDNHALTSHVETYLGQIKESEDTVRKIKTLRDKWISHRDKTAFENPTIFWADANVVNLHDINILVLLLQDIFLFFAHEILVDLNDLIDARIGKLFDKCDLIIQKNPELLLESSLHSASREGRRELNRRDIEIINANADKLNEEALDTLEYQQVNW